MESCHKYTHVEVLFDGAVLDRDRGHRSDEGAPRRALVKLSLLKKLPFVELGHSWDEAFGSAGVLYMLVVVWVRQWCVLVQHCFGLLAYFCTAPRLPAKLRVESRVVRTPAGRRTPPL